VGIREVISWNLPRTSGGPLQMQFSHAEPASDSSQHFCRGQSSCSPVTMLRFQSLEMVRGCSLRIKGCGWCPNAPTRLYTVSAIIRRRYPAHVAAVTKCTVHLPLVPDLISLLAALLSIIAPIATSVPNTIPWREWWVESEGGGRWGRDCG
jgi:hypothetical protein